MTLCSAHPAQLYMAAWVTLHRSSKSLTAEASPLLPGSPLGMAFPGHLRQGMVKSKPAHDFCLSHMLVLFLLNRRAETMRCLFPEGSGSTLLPLRGCWTELKMSCVGLESGPVRSTRGSLIPRDKWGIMVSFFFSGIPRPLVPNVP